MSDSALDILQRLERLEKSNRRWRLGAIAAAGLLAATLAAGPLWVEAQTVVQKEINVEKITAYSIVLMDRPRPGQAVGERGKLYVDDNGDAMLELRSPKYGKSVFLYADKDGGNIELYDPAGTERAALAISEGNAKLVIKNGSGQVIFSTP